MAFESVCMSMGRVRLVDKKQQKFYCARLRYCGSARNSRRTFERASEAEVYGVFLAARTGRFVDYLKQLGHEMAEAEAAVKESAG